MENKILLCRNCVEPKICLIVGAVEIPEYCPYNKSDANWEDVTKKEFPSLLQIDLINKTKIILANNLL